MDIKLTLSMDKTVIERAKKYAEKENKSLSRIVEDYFIKLSSDQEYAIEISPLVKRLSKVVTLSGKHENDKKSYAGHLSRKYSK